MAAKLSNPRYARVFEVLGLHYPSFDQRRIDAFEEEMDKIIEEAFDDEHGITDRI